jgi:serine/threonine protein kinase
VLAPGTLLGGTYEIVRQIAAGGMGQVYEARHARIRQHRLVVKVLHHELGMDEEIRKRFRREAEIISRLKHPNVVQFIDFNWTEGGALYIVMEFLSGVDLARRIEVVGKIPLAKTVAIIDGVAAGLTAAHLVGITHRDLKPGNIFLMAVQGESREVPKVLDFGISKVRSTTSQVTQKSALMGTPGYMAPEQVLGSLDMIDQRTDVFALAAITYEMLAGRPAFNAPDLNSIFYQIINVNPPPLQISGQSDASLAEVNRVMRRGLAKQPIDRFPSVDAFADALLEAAGLVPIDVADIVVEPSDETPVVPSSPRDREPTVLLRNTPRRPQPDPFKNTQQDPAVDVPLITEARDPAIGHKSDWTWRNPLFDPWKSRTSKGLARPPSSGAGGASRRSSAKKIEPPSQFRFDRLHSIVRHTATFLNTSVRRARWVLATGLICAAAIGAFLCSTAHRPPGRREITTAPTHAAAVPVVTDLPGASPAVAGPSLATTPPPIDRAPARRGPQIDIEPMGSPPKPVSSGSGESKNGDSISPQVHSQAKSTSERSHEPKVVEEPPSDPATIEKEPTDRRRPIRGHRNKSPWGIEVQ